jgi:hypothetical protein
MRLSLARAASWTGGRGHGKILCRDCDSVRCEAAVSGPPEAGMRGVPDSCQERGLVTMTAAAFPVPPRLGALRPDEGMR